MPAALLLATAAHAGPNQQRIGLAPVVVTGETAAHIDTHFAQRVRMAMQAPSLELVDLAESWPQDCDQTPCISAAAGQADVEYVVRASVQANQRDYMMHIGLYNASGFEVRGVDAHCEICTYAEAAERLGFEVAAFRGRLSTGGAELSVQAEGPEPQAGTASDTTTHSDGSVGRLDRESSRWLGAGLIGGGVVMVAGGVSMIALEEKNYGPKCSAENTDATGNCEFRHQTREGGIALTVLGVGAAIGGATVLVLSYRSKRGEMAIRTGLRSVRVEGRF